MEAGEQDTDGCEPLQQAVKDKNVKITPMQTGQKAGNPSASYFIEIRSGLTTDPCTYLRTVKKETKCTLIDSGIQDDDDPLNGPWDWYVLYCPTGPPCTFLQNL